MRMCFAVGVRVALTVSTAEVVGDDMSLDERRREREASPLVTRRLKTVFVGNPCDPSAAGA